MIHEDNFSHLARLQGSDPGFFILAVHSYIEKSLRQRYPRLSTLEDRFGDYLREFRNELIEQARGRFIQGLDYLQQLQNQHGITNQVRHNFGTANAEEARAATLHLQRFCGHANIADTAGLDRVLEYLEAWKERRCQAELLKDLERARQELNLERQTGRERLLRLETLERAENEARHLRYQLEILGKQLEQAKQGKAGKDRKVDELREELFARRREQQEQLARLEHTLEEYADARRYIDELSRLTALTRTRSDYEKAVVRLSAEQSKILEYIRLDRDFLVKGSAGTGKTLVLLKAIEKAKGRKGGSGQQELGLEELRGSVALLTYTTTLVKYDRFLSGLMFDGTLDGNDTITTADHYIAGALKQYEPESKVDYQQQYLEELAGRHKPEGFGVHQLASEAEQFVWANDTGESDYLETGFERQGMRLPLQQAERLRLWPAIQAMMAEMLSTGVYTRSAAACRLLHHLGQNPDSARTGAHTVDYMFIDEAQDLPAVVLKALKLCTSKCMVLAGDADQSIYQPGFRFRNAGIDISGRSRILRTNFRNTVAVHRLAEAYRSQLLGHDSETGNEAYRPGPPPELYQAKNRDELAGQLLSRVRFFVDRLGYQPETICVLVTVNKDIEYLGELFEGNGLKLSNVKDTEFDFDSTAGIRASTFHSAKGLDFPVVLPFLYRAPFVGDTYDSQTTERMAANLVYVALTRAMDHLNIFMLEEPGSEALRKLAAFIASPPEA